MRPKFADRPQYKPLPPIVEPWQLLSEDGKVGWCDFMPHAVLSELQPDGVSVALRRRELAPGRVAVQAVVTNESDQAVRLRSIRWTQPMAGDGVWPMLFPNEWQPFYFATENLRGDYYPSGSTLGNRFYKPLPNERVELGWTEDHRFPGLFIGASEKPIGLMCAAATANCFSPIFRLSGGNGVNKWSFEIEENPGGLDALTIEPGRSVEGEWFYLGIHDTNHPQEATDTYYELVREHGGFAREAHNPLSKQRIYCSWNYDFFSDITEAKLLAQIPIVKKHFPSVGFIQLDDGYQKRYADGYRTQFEGVYALDDPFDYDRFPSGGRGVAEAIKAEGLRPAIWIGLFVNRKSKMIEDHPDWILRDDMGREFSACDQYYGNTCILDPSISEVRDYMDRVFRMYLQEWGYEGLKLDFSSIAFESRRARYADSNYTSLHWRRWLLETCRKYLPQDGFFGWGVVAGTGDPLVGSHTDYMRTAFDISEGEWNEIKRIALLTANTLLLMPERPILPNIDSVGWSELFDDSRWYSWLNLCAVSGATLEVSGDLTKLPAERLDTLHRAMALSQPERRTWCLDIPGGEIDHPPAVWVAQGKDRSLLAVINWPDAARTIRLDDERIKRFIQNTRQFTDVWTGQAYTADHLERGLELPACSSVLLEFAPSA